jgi:hypothetical protein
LTSERSNITRSSFEAFRLISARVKVQQGGQVARFQLHVEEGGRLVFLGQDCGQVDRDRARTAPAVGSQQRDQPSGLDRATRRIVEPADRRVEFGFHLGRVDIIVGTTAQGPQDQLRIECWPHGKNFARGKPGNLGKHG